MREGTNFVRDGRNFVRECMNFVRDCTKVGYEFVLVRLDLALTLAATNLKIRSDF